MSAGEKATTGRVRFRFKSIKGSAPVGFIRLDRAIDAVGAKLFPTGWGTLPYFSELPFAWLEFDNDFHRWSLINREGKFVRRRKKVQVANRPRDAFHALDRIYSVACDTLREALERGAIAASVADEKDDYIPVTRALWARRSRSLFFAGALGGPTKRAPFLKSSEFEAWLQVLSEPIARSRRRTMSDAQLKGLFEAAMLRCQAKGYRLTKLHAFACIQEATQLSSLAVSERRLAKAWKTLPGEKKVPGRLPTEQADLQNGDRGELVGQLKSILSGSNPTQ